MLPRSVSFFQHPPLRSLLVSHPSRASGSNSKNLWFLQGLAAAIGFGLWGFLDKLAAPFGATYTNAIIYGVGFVASAMVAGGRFGRHSWSALAAGVCGGLINVLVLFSLQTQTLILVFPFVSFGTVFFVLLHSKLSRSPWPPGQRRSVAAGSVIAITGLVACGVGLSGGTAALGALGSVPVLVVGLTIALLAGLWLFFVWRTFAFERREPRQAAAWIFAGALATAIIALVVLPARPFPLRSLELILPIAAGLALFVGQVATNYAFSGLLLLNSRVKEIVVGVLANSELLPILVLSAAFLNEAPLEGIVGSLLVFLGIFLLNQSVPGPASGTVPDDS